jgi:ornithine decarboxylase
MAAILDDRWVASAAYRRARPVVSFDQAKELAAVHGTPLICVSRSAIRRNFEALRDGLPGVEFYYAAKSNPDATLLRVLRESGCQIDVCSVGELQAALEAGYTPDQMLHTHPCKTMHNLMTC